MATDNDHQAQAAKYLSDERLFDAARELAKVDKQALTPEEEKVVKKAEEMEKVVDVARNGVDESSWIDLGEYKERGRSNNCAYKITWGPLKVDFFVDLSVERSLVLPVIAILNEVDLFKTWLPKWGRPTKLEFVRTETLQRSGFSCQDMTVRVEAPLATVETYMSAEGVNDTAVNREVVLALSPLEVGDLDGLVPPHVEGINRVKTGIVALFRKASEDKEQKAKKLRGKKLKQDEEFITISIVASYGNEKTFLKGGFLVRKLAKFVLKIASGMMLHRLLSVAEEVRDHKLPEFEKAMAEKPETYEWVKGCISGILD